MTLEVSKLSGWLNAAAFCQVEKACMRCRERCGLGRRKGVGRRRRRRARQGLTVKAGGRRGAHEEHELHVRDAGRVEAQRLVERRRDLPSRKEGVYDARRGVGRTREGMSRQQRTISMHGERGRL